VEAPVPSFPVKGNDYFLDPTQSGDSEAHVQETGKSFIAVPAPALLLGLPVLRFIQIIDLETSDTVLTAASDLVGDSSVLLALTDSSSSGEAAGVAWKNYLNVAKTAPSRLETEEGQNALLFVQLVVHGAFVDATRMAGQALSVSLKRVGLGWLGTWREINIRLAGQLYRHGLHISRNRNEEATAVSFRAALQCWAVAEILDSKSTPSQRRIWRGMRAVVRLFFARRMEDSSAELKLAIQDFEEAEYYGDHTAEHYAMRAESHMRLFAQTEDDAQLALTETCLAAAKGKGHETAELLAGRGQLFFCRGLRAMVAAGARSSVTDSTPSDVSGDLPDSEITDVAEERSSALSPCLNRNALMAAVAAFAASALWHGRSAVTSTNGLRNPQVPIIQQGQARLRAAHARRLLGLSYQRQVIAAVADLVSCAEPGAPISGPYWPWALLEQARLLIRQDTEEAFRQAHRSVAQAVRYAEEHLEPQSTLTRRLHALEIEVLLRLAIAESNIADIRITLPLALMDDENARVPVTPLIYAARLLVSTANAGESATAMLPMEDRQLIRKVVDHLAEIANKCDSGTRRFTASHAATLLVLCDGSGPVDECEHEVLRRIYSLARLAYDTDPEATDSVLLSQLARAATRYARSVLRSATDDCHQVALELFSEAIDAYKRITDFDDAEAFNDHQVDLRVAERERQPSVQAAPLFFDESQHASFLGETYLRRHSLRRDSEDLRAAIRWLQHSADTGNDTPENCSLLGEALIRLGRREHDVQALQQGFELKTASHIRGSYSRESLSVSAAAAVALWSLTHDSNCYIKAAEMAALAAAADPEWPWPLLQLTEFAEADQAQRHLLPSHPPANRDMPDIPVELWELVRNGESKQLINRACAIAARSREFASLILGGRSKVYVLDDPHGLLSSSLVLKPRESRADADTEMTRLSGFASYLSKIGAPWWADTIQPLAVVESAIKGTVIAVSRRERGRTLSSILADELGEMNYPSTDSLSFMIDTYRRVLVFLALVHGWRGLPRAQRTAEVRNLFSRSFVRELSALGVRDPEGSFDKWCNVIPGGLPLVGKRDAHSDNWLVTDRGRIVALDLESTSFLPIGFEVAQLLEDMPLLPVNEEGMNYRRSLASTYLAELGKRMPQLAQDLPSADSDIWWTAYACFAARRAIFLLNKFRRNLPTDTSSSAAVIAKARTDHAWSLLQWASEQIPDLASLYPTRRDGYAFGSVAN
jgi:hypothetical protein